MLEPFFNTDQAWRSANLLKKTTTQVFSCEYHFSPIALKYDPSKHLLNFKTCWRCLQHVFSATIFLFPRRFANKSWESYQNISQEVLKTSWRHLQRRKLLQEDVLRTSRRRLANTSSRRLEDISQDVLEGEKLLHWRRLEDVFETCFEDVLEKNIMFTGEICI